MLEREIGEEMGHFAATQQFGRFRSEADIAVSFAGRAGS
jgi:hypothetical protein